MANHKSAKKRAKRNATAGKQNSARVSSIRTAIKKVEVALLAGNYKDAQDALKKVQPQLAKGVSKGVIKKATASRKMSRLTKKVKTLKK